MAGFHASRAKRGPTVVAIDGNVSPLVPSLKVKEFSFPHPPTHEKKGEKVTMITQVFVSCHQRYSIE